MAVRRKHIRNLVERILTNQKVVNAPIEIENIAHLYGVKVQYEPAQDNLSGFLLRNLKEHKAIIGVNQSHHPNRQRFTIAHELGHFFLHETERMYVDRIFQVKLRNENSSKGISTEEKEANLFAAEILMPVRFLKKDLAQVNTLDLYEDEKLKDLSEKYQVSTQAFTFRLAYLNYIQL